MSFSPTSRFWAAPPAGNGCLITELSRFSNSVRDLRYPIIRLITRLSESLTTFRAPARILHNGASVHERGHRRTCLATAGDKLGIDPIFHVLTLLGAKVQRQCGAYRERLQLWKVVARAHPKRKPYAACTVLCGGARDETRVLPLPRLMSASGVRREKAALSSGCKPSPGNRSSRKQPEQPTASDIEGPTDLDWVSLGFETEISRCALDSGMAQERSNCLQIASAFQNVESLRPA